MHGAVLAMIATGRSRQGLVSRTAGTAIGNLVNGGGLAAAFDGVTSQAAASSALINTGDRTIGYIGKDWGAGVTRTITGFTAYAPSDQGFNQINPGTVTLELQGSTDNFASSVVSLGTLSVPSGETAGLVSSKLTGMTRGAYRYHRLKITSASGTTSTDNKQCAELLLYEDTAI